MFEHHKCCKPRGENQNSSQYANDITLFFLNQWNHLKMNKTCKGTNQLQNEQADNETLLVEKIESCLWLTSAIQKSTFLKKEHKNLTKNSAFDWATLKPLDNN